MTEQWNWLPDLISIPFLCIIMLAFDICFYSIITFNNYLFPNAMHIPKPIIFITTFLWSTAIGLLFVWMGDADRKYKTS
jgi:hypothetical protein